MNNPAANRRTQSNELHPNALPVSRKILYIVAIGSAALILFSSLSMWVMGRDLAVKSKKMNEVVGQIETMKQESVTDKKEIESLSNKVTANEQSIQQLTLENNQLKQDNDDLTKKYRERRDALEKKRLTLASNSVIPIQTNISNIKNAQPTGVFNASFYTAGCSGCSGKTFLGEKPQPGVTIAVDTHYWKLGTKFYVEGFGVLIAQDTGGAIKGKYRVDICVSTTREALDLGMKNLKFWVLD